MSLVSIWFLLFLAVCVPVYYLFPKRIQWVWLLAAGLCFYVLCSFGLVFVPVLVTVIAFFFGRLFETKKNKKLMFLAVVLILAVLFVFKYAKWLGAGWVRAVSGLSFGFSESLLIPLGISYYSIMAIAYLTDVFRGTVRAEGNFAKLLLFLSFFPVVTQGPILRFKESSIQIFSPHVFRYRNLTDGIQRMIWGFFKKLVISERLAVLCSHITQGWGESAYSGIYVLLSVFAFSFRLYMDFSGCIDIVIGTAEIFGIRLPENFNHSYLSRTIPEFWRRWHITLGTWLRDYVMYSVTMSGPAKKFTKKAKAVIGRKAAALLVTCFGTCLVWLVYALWHDISWTFLLSGGFFAVIIILSTVFDPLIRRFRKRFERLVASLPYLIFMTLRTMLLSMMGAFFVFMPTVKDGLSYLGSLFRAPTGLLWEAPAGDGFLTVLGLELPDLIVLAAAFILWIVVSRLHAKKDPRDLLAQMPIVPRWLILLVMVMAVIIFGVYGGLDAGSFVYQAF